MESRRMVLKNLFTGQQWRNRTSLMAQMVKRLPTRQETQVWSLGQEDALEKEMAPHSSTLAWKIPWTEDPGRLQFMGSQRVRHSWATSLTHSLTQFHQLSLPNNAVRSHFPLHPHDYWKWSSKDYIVFPRGAVEKCLHHSVEWLKWPIGTIYFRDSKHCSQKKTET